MTTRSSTHTHGHPNQKVEAVRRTQRRKSRRRTAVIGGVAAVLIAVVAAMMASSRSTANTTAREAPGFTLTDTTGKSVSLAGLKGHPVVLFFSEGAGCGSCLQQMASIEKDQASFNALGVTVLPIVMNTKDQITRDMNDYGVTTPFLLDDGKVSTAYGTLGKGMHAGLPGHAFVLIDKDGVQRWSGEYPSMFVPTAELLTQVRKSLAL